MLRLDTFNTEQVVLGGQYDWIRFYTASCSGCALKEEISRLRMETVKKGSKVLHVFAFSANQHELAQILKDERVKTGSVYHDSTDYFGLGLTEVESGVQPVMIPIHKTMDKGGI